MLYLKLALMIPLYTPFLHWVIALTHSVEQPAEDVTGIQFFFVLLILGVSVFARYYREDVTKSFSLGGLEEFHKFDDQTAINSEDPRAKEIQMQRFN